MLGGSSAQVSGACDEQREFIKYAYMDKIKVIKKNLRARSKYSVYSNKVGTGLDCLEFISLKIQVF